MYIFYLYCIIILQCTVQKHKIHNFCSIVITRQRTPKKNLATSQTVFP